MYIWILVKYVIQKKNLETHHIKDQQYSDDNKMIERHHQNIKHNLVQLCKERSFKSHSW